MSPEMRSIRDKVKTGKPIPFRLVRKAHVLGATKAELMRATGLSRYSLNLVLVRRYTKENE